MSNQEKLEQLERLENIVGLMDSNFKIFGFTFGIDAVIGLIPGLGDIFGGVVSLLILLRIRSIGVSQEVFDKMLLNTAIDTFFGSIPLIGDLFDFAFKVNEKNLALAKEHFSNENA